MIDFNFPALSMMTFAAAMLWAAWQYQELKSAKVRNPERR
jgi:hypothetical protein